jgi:hypothetical protein
MCRGKKILPLTDRKRVLFFPHEGMEFVEGEERKRGGKTNE